MIDLDARKAAARSLKTAVARLFGRGPSEHSECSEAQPQREARTLDRVGVVDRLLGFEPLDDWWLRVASAEGLSRVIRQDGARRRANATEQGACSTARER